MYSYIFIVYWLQYAVLMLCSEHNNTSTPRRQLLRCLCGGGVAVDAVWNRDSTRDRVNYIVRYVCADCMQEMETWTEVRPPPLCPQILDSRPKRARFVVWINEQLCVLINWATRRQTLAVLLNVDCYYQFADGQCVCACGCLEFQLIFKRSIIHGTLFCVASNAYNHMLLLSVWCPKINETALCLHVCALW